MQEPFDMRSAWIDLLLMCNHSDKRILFDGELITIERGQYLTSVRKLSQKWMWSKDRVFKFLKLLESDGMIIKYSDKRRTLLTIINYELFQDCQDTDKDNKQTVTGQSLATNNNEKNDNNEKNNTMCKADAYALFEHLWKLYPVKKGKGQVSDTAKMRLLEIGQEEMERSISRYKNYLSDNEWVYPKNGSTFFKSGYIDYLDANFDSGKKQTNTKNGFNSFPQRDYDFEELEKELLENT